MKLTKYIAIRFIGVATLVLLISVPLFHFVLQRVIWNSIDENMQFQRKWTENQLRTILPEHFVSFNNNVIIRPGLFPYSERFYNENIYIPYDNGKYSSEYILYQFSTGFTFGQKL